MDELTRSIDDLYDVPVEEYTDEELILMIEHKGWNTDSMEDELYRRAREYVDRFPDDVFYDSDTGAYDREASLKYAAELLGLKLDI